MGLPLGFSSGEMGGRGLAHVGLFHSDLATSGSHGWFLLSWPCFVVSRLLSPFTDRCCKNVGYLSIGLKGVHGCMGTLCMRDQRQSKLRVLSPLTLPAPICAVYWRSFALDVSQTIQGTVLDGHALELKRSTKRLTPNTEAASSTSAQGDDVKRSKLIIRNIPFQVGKHPNANIPRLFPHEVGRSYLHVQRYPTRR